MREKTKKQQVESGVAEVIEKLQKEGVQYLKFKDLEFETDEYIINCNVGFNGYGFDIYEVKLAWQYMKANFDYDRYFLKGKDANCKFFKIAA